MLTIDHLTKSYGKTKVLKDISFTIPSASICGFVGKNGAGKTTFSIHCLILSPTKGIFP